MHKNKGILSSMILQISVVMPVYNRQNFVGAALESALKQTRPSCEIIVVDDGSTDDTARVVERIAGEMEDRRSKTGEGPELKLIRQRNAGPSAARNAGIAQAQGDYVAFLDSDDLWFPWTLECYAEAIAEHARPGILLGQWVQGTEYDPEVSAAPLKTKGYTDFLEGSRDHHFFSSNNVVMRRDLIVGTAVFCPAIRVYEDKDLALRSGTQRGFVKIESPGTVFYRATPGSLSLNLPESKKGLRHIVREEKAERYPGGAGRARDRRRYICHTVRSLSRRLLKAGERGAAFEFYRDSLVWHLSLGRLRYLLGFWLELARSKKGR
jgi:glycosyltransferase involved in cell wall biosynthesis